MARSVTMLILLVCAAPALAQIKVQTSPSPIVLGQTRTAVLEIRGLPGLGAARVDVNVGRVLAVEPRADRIRVTYQLPPQRFPQWLCMLLQRGAGAAVWRQPLLAPASVPITTRKHAQVTLTIGHEVFGPTASGSSGKLQMKVLVPPDITEGWAEAIDDKGMQTRKRVDIRQHPHNLLAVGLQVVGPARQPEVRISVAAADLSQPAPAVSVVPPGAGPSTLTTTVSLSPRAEGLWRGRFRPRPTDPRGEWRLRVHGREPGSSHELTFRLSDRPVPASRPTQVRSTPEPVADGGMWDRIRFNVSLAAGMQHNLGLALGPRFTTEAGADYPLGPGRIGVRLVAGLSWATRQEVPLGGELSPASSTVVLIPVGALLTYRLPLKVAPYAAVGVVAQIVRTDTEGEDTDRWLRTDVVPGVLGMLGADLRLGPGAVFLQGGYQYGRLQNEDVDLLAGGVVLETGYRLEL